MECGRQLFGNNLRLRVKNALSDICFVLGVYQTKEIGLAGARCPNSFLYHPGLMEQEKVCHAISVISVMFVCVYIRVGHKPPKLLLKSLYNIAMITDCVCF